MPVSRTLDVTWVAAPLLPPVPGNRDGVELLPGVDGVGDWLVGGNGEGVTGKDGPKEGVGK